MHPPFAISVSPPPPGDRAEPVRDAWLVASPALAGLLQACLTSGQSDDAALVAAVIRHFEGGPGGGGRAGEPPSALSADPSGSSSAAPSSPAASIPAASIPDPSSAVRPGEHGTHASAGDLPRSLRTRAHHDAAERRAARHRGEPTLGVASLSAAESRVCQAIAIGLSNKAIASELCLSRRTVEGHVARSLRKLGVTSRVQIAMLIRAERDAGALLAS